MQKYFLQIDDDVIPLDELKEDKVQTLAKETKKKNPDKAVSLYSWWGCKNALEMMLDKYDWFANMEDLTYYGLVETDYSQCKEIKYFS